MGLWSLQSFPKIKMTNQKGMVLFNFNFMKISWPPTNMPTIEGLMEEGLLLIMKGVIFINI